MREDEIKAIFDQQAASYDERWAKTAPIRDSLHFLLTAVFAGLPDDARVLCVGAGTGEEIDFLARRFPRWTFIAVDPSAAMLDVCRAKARQGGYADRCDFHEGYVDSLPMQAAFDAATCFLVSQFILDEDARISFFRAIASRLRPGAVLASSDLASDVRSREYEALLETWLNLMLSAGVPAAGLEQMRANYARDVSILPPARVAAIIAAAGFDTPVQFHQAGLIHAWYAPRGKRRARRRSVTGTGTR
jgi:tRNA (cmo5U34)-methyltransferase